MARKNKPNDPADATRHDAQNIPAGPAIDMETLMPGLRARHDGWTEERTQRFLDVLAHTGCVDDACRVAGMSDTGAYRMKDRFPAFSAAWDDALERAQQGLIAIAYKRAVEGKETVIIRRGEEYERRIAPSDSMLGLLVKRGDMKDGRAALSPDKVLTAEEWALNWKFDINGNKIQGEPRGSAEKRVRARIEAMRDRLLHHALKGGTCVMCCQKWPKDDPRSMAEMVAAGVISMEAFMD
jgi:hypothetical protein